jgi:hypothetical protein
LVFILGVHAHFFATFARLGHAVRHLAARDELHTKQRATLQHVGRVQTKGKERQQQSQYKRREKKGSKATATPNNAAQTLGN